MKTEKSILVVDDDPQIINIVFSIISKANPDYIFLQANSGVMGYQVACLKKPDLIITDWDMPGLNGIDFIRKLKENDEVKDIPIIMASGVMTSSQNLQTALNAGAVDYIRKPIDPIELEARVNSMLILAGYIQEIKKKNETIIEANIFLNDLINTIPFPIVYYDTEGNSIISNKSFSSICNMEVGKSVYGCFLKDGIDTHYAYDQQLINESKQIITYEGVIGFCDNKIHDIIFTKSLVHDYRGSLKGIICVMSDVTELKKAHRDAMERQKSDLANITLRLIQTCELNEKIINDISQLAEYTNRKGSDLIREIICNYKYAVNDNIWSEFEKRFNDVHADFYRKLGDAHPDLTPNERKLCAFSKLNMSSKEIASITFQNVKSIDMARYRLRKKLGLNEEDSFLTYISKF